MEQLISLGKEALQNVAEYVASYRLGQSALRQLDRTLWVVEKCARWAVPPPLDQDEQTQPVLVRPLPWVFFLVMLVTLRVTRESISLVNLVLGKPPLRSADVVMFIQSKRRYLRTLKYQGNRMMRARTSTQPQQPWYTSLNSLFDMTMCFRRQSHVYGNNNTTPVTNNDEVVVIQCVKPEDKEDTSFAASLRETESTMERLIEKIMVNLDAESDEDSTYTVTNNDSSKTLKSENSGDQDTIHQPSPPSQPFHTDISQTNGDEIHFSPKKNVNSSSTPEKTEPKQNHTKKDDINNQSKDDTSAEYSPKKAEEKRKLEENITESAYTGNSVSESTNTVNMNSEVINSVNVNSEDKNSINVNSESKKSINVNSEGKNYVNVNSKGTNSINTISKDAKSCEDSNQLPPQESDKITPKQATESFIRSENAANLQRAPKKEQKIGRKYKSWSNTMKHLFNPKGNGEQSPREAELQRSSSAKSVTLAQFVLNEKGIPTQREVMSE